MGQPSFVMGGQYPITAYYVNPISVFRQSWTSPHYRGFDEADIVIAFPQREAHFHSEQPIRIAIDTPPDN